MAVHAEKALVLFQDEHGEERPDATMLDPGASAFLSGYGPFKRYLDHLSSFIGLSGQHHPVRPL